MIDVDTTGGRDVWSWQSEYPAPAKLNLFLHVVGRRADGYHLLQTVFRFVDYADSLHFSPRDDGAIVLANPLPGVPPDLEGQVAIDLAELALRDRAVSALEGRVEVLDLRQRGAEGPVKSRPMLAPSRAEGLT